jgi:hypothetical protein
MELVEQTFIPKFLAVKLGILEHVYRIQVIVALYHILQHNSNEFVDV